MFTASSDPLTIVTNLEDAVVPTDVEGVQSTDRFTDRVQKMIHNGLLFIKKDGKTYNAQGAVIKE